MSYNVSRKFGKVSADYLAIGDIEISSTDAALDLSGIEDLNLDDDFSINNASTKSIGIADDAVSGNVNIGTGALARTVTVGNITGASALVLSAGTEGIAVPTASATQTSTISTTVAIDGISGIITTVSATTAGAATSTFTVSNTVVKSTSRVLVSIVNYSGTYATNGFPMVHVSGITADAFDIKLSNVHASNALSGIVKIAFLVLN